MTVHAQECWYSFNVKMFMDFLCHHVIFCQLLYDIGVVLMSTFVLFKEGHFVCLNYSWQRASADFKPQTQTGLKVVHAIHLVTAISLWPRSQFTWSIGGIEDIEDRHWRHRTHRLTDSCHIKLTWMSILGRKKHEKCQLAAARKNKHLLFGQVKGAIFWFHISLWNCSPPVLQTVT